MIAWLTAILTEMTPGKGTLSYTFQSTLMFIPSFNPSNILVKCVMQMISADEGLRCGHRHMMVSVCLNAGSQSRQMKRPESYHSGPGSSMYRRFPSAGWSPGQWSRSCTHLLSERCWLGGGARGPSRGLWIQHWDGRVQGVSRPLVSNLLLLSPYTTHLNTSDLEIVCPKHWGSLC